MVNYISCRQDRNKSAKKVKTLQKRLYKKCLACYTNKANSLKLVFNSMKIK